MVRPRRSVTRRMVPLYRGSEIRMVPEPDQTIGFAPPTTPSPPPGESWPPITFFHGPNMPSWPGHIPQREGGGRGSCPSRPATTLTPTIIAFPPGTPPGSAPPPPRAKPPLPPHISGPERTPPPLGFSSSKTCQPSPSSFSPFSLTILFLQGRRTPPSSRGGGVKPST